MSLDERLIPETDDEYGISEFLLQLNLNAPKLKIKECFDISCEKCDSLFEKYTSRMPNSNIVDVFIPLMSIQQPISDILKNGIRVNKTNGFKFITGSVPIDKSAKVHEVIHIAVALGVIMNHEPLDSMVTDYKWSSEEPKSSKLRPECDSLRLSSRNEFIIYSSAQIKPLHIIRFEGGDNIAHDPHILNECSVCKKRNATLWCENDSIKLCPQCDSVTHNANPVFSQHVRVDLSKALAHTEMCRFHPNYPYQYFCSKCHIPLCVECKIHGSHSKGEQSRHKLFALPELYDDLKDKLIDPNPVFELRKSSIVNKLNDIDAALNGINENEEKVRSQIQRIAQRALEDARIRFHNRANELKSSKIELQRKLQEIETHESMIKLHSNSSLPTTLLRASIASNILESDLQGNHDLPVANTSCGEIKVIGSLNIVINGPENSGPTFSYRPFVDEDEMQVSETENNEKSNKKEDQGPKITTLEKMSQRKESKYIERGLQLSFQPFKNSEIINDPALGRKLYMCFPFKEQPETHLMFSTNRDGRSIQKMHRMIDGMGITAVLVRAGEYVFGGFAATKWNCDAVRFGNNTSTFIFSVTRDAFIPYKPQCDDPCYLFATSETLTFGMDDLKLAGDFDDCSSCIENSFGVGFKYGSEKCQTFLAGVPKFRADIVEVWGFFSK